MIPEEEYNPGGERSAGRWGQSYNVIWTLTSDSLSCLLLDAPRALSHIHDEQVFLAWPSIISFVFVLLHPKDFLTIQNSLEVASMKGHDHDPDGQCVGLRGAEIRASFVFAHSSTSTGPVVHHNYRLSLVIGLHRPGFMLSRRIIRRLAFFSHVTMPSSRIRMNQPTQFPRLLTAIISEGLSNSVKPSLH